MVGAAQRRLDIAENHIHPPKCGALHVRSSTADNNLLARTAGHGDAGKVSQPIGGHSSACRKALLHPRGHRGCEDSVADTQLNAHWVSFLVGPDGGRKRSLSGRRWRATTALAPASLATVVGIIETDPVGEGNRRRRIHHHHLHRLVSHPSRRVAKVAQITVQFHRRDALVGQGRGVADLESHGDR